MKCRVIHRPLGTKSRSASTTTADGDASGGSFQPVELSVRESRLDPARDAGEAARREGAPEVGSTAKVRLLCRVVCCCVAIINSILVGSFDPSRGAKWKRRTRQMGGFYQLCERAAHHAIVHARRLSIVAQVPVLLPVLLGMSFILFSSRTKCNGNETAVLLGIPSIFFSTLCYFRC